VTVNSRFCAKSTTALASPEDALMGGYRPALGCQDDHGDDAIGLRLVLGELRDALGLGAVQAVAFLAGRFTGDDLDRVGPELDRDVGVALEIVVSVGVPRRASLRCEYDVAPLVV